MPYDFAVTPTAKRNVAASSVGQPSTPPKRLKKLSKKTRKPEKYDDLKKRLGDLFTTWADRLGLWSYRIEVMYYENHAEYMASEGEFEPSSAMNVEVNWPYATAQVRVCLPVMAEVAERNEALVEEYVIHELLHIRLAGLREGTAELEERTVCELSRAILALAKS